MSELSYSMKIKIATQVYSHCKFTIWLVAERYEQIIVQRLTGLLQLLHAPKNGFFPSVCKMESLKIAYYITMHCKQLI